MSLVNLTSGRPVPSSLKSAIGSSGGGIEPLIPIIILGLICGVGRFTASSCYVEVFACGGTVPGSKLFIRIHPRLDVPLNTVILSMIVQVLLDTIYVPSSDASNTFSRVGLLVLNAVYATPLLGSRQFSKPTAQN